MKYWVYLNDKVVGPYDEDNLASLEGFTPDTLICSADGSNGNNQEWVKASSIFEFDQAPAAAPAAASASQPAANAASASAMDQSLAQLLIDKLDNLGKEIGSLKGKVDEALAASTAAQAAAQEAAQQATAAATRMENMPAAAAPVKNNTPSETEPTPVGKPVDFLNEIKIDDKMDEQDNKEEGEEEEVVLRSALDSLYMSKNQPEEEKEDTFQDLLSPFKETDTENTKTTQENEGKEDVKEESAEQTSEQQPADSVEISDEKREEIIQEITASDSQDNAVLQAIEDAQTNQSVEEATSEETKSKDDSVQEVPAAETIDELLETLPPAQEAPASTEAVPPAKEEQSVEEIVPSSNVEEKQSLDLTTDSEQLTITNIPEDKPAVQLDPQLTETAQPEEEPLNTEITPMNPDEDLQNGNSETKEETAQELVPGKKLEAAAEEEDTGDEILSQADLDAAFDQQPQSQEFSLPEDQKGAADGSAFVNPKDMTEVQLNEGSTYLISDFIPPAVSGTEANRQKEDGDDADASATEPDIEEIVSSSSELEFKNGEEKAELTEDAETKENTENAEGAEAAEESKSSEKQVDDLTVSQVTLENTIQSKRGASMDIKTVPMLPEPADSDRLDLEDSDLDINAQHDLKAADSSAKSSKLSKVILTTLISIVFVAVIYIMLAYLEIIPAQFNVFKSAAPAAEQEAVQDNTLNEMLEEEDVTGQKSAEAEGTDLLEPILTEVKNYPMVNGQTLEQLINSRHAAAQQLIDWTITTAVEPDNYSVLVKVPPENPQSFKISYRFNYNAVAKTLEPTISDSKNLLDSIQAK